MKAVIKGLELWTNANSRSTLNTNFVWVPGAANPTVILRTYQNVLDLHLNVVQGITRVLESDKAADGTVLKATVDINVDSLTQTLTNDGYLKVTLHETGHLLGLGDNLFPAPGNKTVSGKNGSSVMNGLGNPSDALGWLPFQPTNCDVAQAWAAPTRP
jgi:hypothetical protein